MHIDARGGIAIADIVVFVPALILAVIICVRHGFGRVSGWIYLLILCLVRVIGAVCQLLIYTNPSQGLIETASILETVGLSPLLLATLGMLSRLVDWINASKGEIFSVKQFRLVQLLITLGLILSIAGASGGTSGGQVQIATTVKVAIVLFIIAFLACIFVTVVSMARLSGVPRHERVIAAAVALALPFIGVRLVYSTLAVFLDDSVFALGGGSIAVYVLMAVAEEWIVVGIYLLLGFRVQTIGPGEQGQLMSRPFKRSKDRNREPRRRRERRSNGDRGSNGPAQSQGYYASPLEPQDVRYPSYAHVVGQGGRDPERQ